jgi:hypothetical protein
MHSSIVSSKFYKSKLLASSLVLALILGLGFTASSTDALAASREVITPPAAVAQTAKAALEKLAVKGRAPKTGYARDLFSDGWGDQPGGCDSRNFILKRDLTRVTWRSGEFCIVATGVLADPYTGKKINFTRGVKTSLAVQIDHVVAVSDAWQKGAQQATYASRNKFYNDPLNLLAVDGPTNGSKSDSDAASWLPPNKAYRCAYVARQVAVKLKYKLWVTNAEKAAIAGVLAKCPSQKLPVG